MSYTSERSLRQGSRERRDFKILKQDALCVTVIFLQDEPVWIGWICRSCVPIFFSHPMWPSFELADYTTATGFSLPICLFSWILFHLNLVPLSPPLSHKSDLASDFMPKKLADHCFLGVLWNWTWHHCSRFVWRCLARHCHSDDHSDVISGLCVLSGDE